MCTRLKHSSLSGSPLMWPCIVRGVTALQEMANEILYNLKVTACQEKVNILYMCEPRTMGPMAQSRPVDASVYMDGLGVV